MVGMVGVEPTTVALTVRCSAIELLGIECFKVGTKGFEPLAAPVSGECSTRLS